MTVILCDYKHSQNYFHAEHVIQGNLNLCFLDPGYSYLALSFLFGVRSVFCINTPVFCGGVMFQELPTLIVLYAHL